MIALALLATAILAIVASTLATAPQNFKAITAVSEKTMGMRSVENDRPRVAAGYTVLPEFGAYNLSSCSGAPACGTNMASYNGIWAKSNGANQCSGNSCGSYSTYGSQYQCVEYAQRYMAQLYGTAPIWHVNAIDMCASHPSGVYKTTTPKAGDLVVFGWAPYGHVAVITKISSGYVYVVEQNGSPTGTNSYAQSSVECYLTANKPTGSCSHLGYYCGNDGLGLDANTLYYCSGAGASPTVKTKCSFTCVTMPSGQDDQCSTSGSCSAVNTGYYCGGDKINGDKNTLYLCKSSAPAGAKYCANGCVTAASGYDDYCK